MALEIERRFLIDQDKFPMRGHPIIGITQGYLSVPSAKHVTRVRVARHSSPESTYAFLTLKRKVWSGIAKEYEYNIPLSDALEMLEGCEGSLIFKERHIFGHWEVDFFTTSLQGIVIAEIELKGINQEFIKPGWLGREITDVKALSNFQMSQDPGLAKAVYDELILTQNMEAKNGII